MSDINDFLRNLNYYLNLETKQKKLINIISNIRLLISLSGAFFVIMLFINKYKDFSITLLGVLLVLFIFLIVKHNRAKDDLKRIQCKIEINQKYIDRINGNWTNFVDRGTEFVDVNHAYTNDLDIFGPKSLFQWINVGNTYFGRRILKGLLCCPQKDVNLIKERQDAVKELEEKSRFCEELQCVGLLAKGIGYDPQKFLSYVENGAKLFKWKWIESIFYILPGLTVISITLPFLNLPISPYIPLAMITLQFIITVIGYKRVATVLNTVNLLKDNIGFFSNLIGVIEKEEFKGKYLSQLKSKLFYNNRPASYQIKRLEKIVDAVDTRYNAVLYAILNFTLLWDYHCVFAVEKWKAQNGKAIRKWLQTLGAFEAISSLAVVQQINPTWVFPEFDNKDLKFIARELGHPLIAQDKRISNDISIQNNLCVITGSNMSGKTTLLRTLGINLVLAYAGAPVCAKQLQSPIMDIFTSMRVTDDLNSGISTFYAELLRIKMIIEFSHQKKAMLFLIDEIFRGTNSEDRIIGARNVMKNLSKDWVIGLISTHDFELCELEKEKNTRIKNYHFTESYENNEIKFDYKIRPGRCKTTNAKYLMKMVGIELEE